MPQTVPLNELAVAVQNAVQQVLGKHGAVPIDQLWVGFVAPETLANQQELAGQVAAALGREGGVHATASVGQLGAAATGAQKTPAALPPKILGLIYKPKVQQ